MGIIRKLDEHTTNLIAAGEVIERSSSVVKELVENSIDAKATQIRIRLVDSGLTEISVLDNGVGMDYEDAKMAIVPHATSKIKDGNDLFKISTLGFRGEALASIVAVSNFTLKTSKDGVKGVMYTIKGGVLVSEAIISHPRGTEIIVKNLFFNTPARLQNVSSQSMELSYVTDYVNKMALANPHIAFTLINNDKEILRTYGNGELLEVIQAVYKTEVAKDMIQIFEDDGFFKIHGYTSKLKTNRSSKNHITTIVNGRVIKNANIINAVVQGYDEYLLTGRYPITVLNIEVDPGMVDVNVHPAKLEIRFSNERRLLDLITERIRKSLKSLDLSVNLDKVEEKDTLDLLDLYDEVDLEELDEEIEDLFDEEVSKEKPLDLEETYKPVETVVNKSIINEYQVKEEPVIEKPVYKQQEYTFLKDETVDANTTKLPLMNYVGQLHGTYILAQSEDMFYIIDQHAAAERINYEKILEELKKDNVISYELLIPFKVDFTTSEAVLINDNISNLNKLGIKIEDFGGGSFMVREVPIWFKRGFEKEYVEEIITQLINNGKKEKYEFLREVAKGIACKKSIKGNEYHSKLELEYLLEDLRNAQNPFTCPHGRPVIIKFSKNEIEKWFKRIV